MPVDLLETGGDDRPSSGRRWGSLAGLLVVGVAAAVWLPSRLDGRTAAEDAPSLRLSVSSFSTSGQSAEVLYSVVNDGREPVRLVDIAFEDDVARVESVRLPPGDIQAGQVVGAAVAVRFSCARAESRPVRPGLRLTTVTAGGQRRVVSPGPGSDLGLDAGGGSLLTGPATAPCSACVDVLDALASVDAQAHEADRSAAARAARRGTRVVVPGVVEQAQRTLRAAQDQLPADQSALAATALDALADIAADGAASADSFAVLDRVQDDLEELCDPAVPEVLR